MKVLIAVALCTSVADAQPRTFAVQIHRRTDAGRLQLGTGVTTGDTQTLDLSLGFHLTDRVLVRARQRLWLSSTELEAGYALGVGKMLVPGESIVRMKLFALAGGGMTYDKEPTAHAALALHTHIFDWLTLELGARGTYGPTIEPWVARTTMPVPTSHALGVEVFTSLAFVFPGPSYECVIR